MELDTAKWEVYIKEMHKDARIRMDNKSLDLPAINAFIKHLPITEEWPSRILECSSKLLIELYDYSKQMNFIDNSISFKEFINYRR